MPAPLRRGRWDLLQVGERRKRVCNGIVRATVQVAGVLQKTGQC